MSRKNRAKKRNRNMPNEQARALFARAGNAGMAIAVDTRPKTVASRKPDDRRKARADLRAFIARGSDDLPPSLPDAHAG